MNGERRCVWWHSFCEWCITHREREERREEKRTVELGFHTHFNTSAHFHSPSSLSFVLFSRVLSSFAIGICVTSYGCLLHWRHRIAAHCEMTKHRALSHTCIRICSWYTYYMHWLNAGPSARCTSCFIHRWVVAILRIFIFCLHIHSIHQWQIVVGCAGRLVLSTRAHTPQHTEKELNERRR